MFFKPEKCDLFVAFDFSISYTPNCTIPSYNFEKISGEGLTKPPPQTPPLLLLGIALNSGSALEFVPREANLDPSLAELPLVFLPGCAPEMVQAMRMRI